MALAFVSVSIVNATAGSSAVGLSAYVTREERSDAVTGKSFDFKNRESDLITKGIILPVDAPDDFSDGEKLWQSATEAETVIDKKTKEVRFSGRAGKSPQIAKHLIIALPWDDNVSDDHRIEMAHDFIKEQFGAAGVAAEYAVHSYGTAFKLSDAKENAEVRAQLELITRLQLEKIRIKAGEKPPQIKGPHVLVWEQDDGSENWQLYQPHAHVLVSTRRVCRTGFRQENGRPTAKARELNPDFNKFGQVKEEDGWRHRWRDFQQTYFAARGMVVEIAEDRAVPDKHRGKARSVGTATDRENADRLAERLDVAFDPDAMLDQLTLHQSTFTYRDIQNALRRHGASVGMLEELADQIVMNPRITLLFDRETGEAAGILTTRDVREEETETFQLWMVLAGKTFGFSETAISSALVGLDEEQATAYRYALQPGSGVRVIQGDPGTGKSFTMGRIRQAMEADGLQVWGGSNMNSVVQDMKAGAGFKNADTLAALIGGLEQNRVQIRQPATLIIDEAAMSDNAMMGRVARQALRFNMRVVIVGDDKQNAAVGRGGIYTDIREAIGEIRLTEVRRHHESWQRQATKDLSSGRIAAGVAAYDDHGRIHWTGSLDDAAAAAAEHAKRIIRGGQDVFVLASTNREKDRMNRTIREAMVLPPGIMLQTKDGVIEISEGERIQLYASRKLEGLYNSTYGTVERIDGDSMMTVMFDDGRRVAFNPGRFRDFGYGYSGTIYRDQGKTRREVIALYDSKFMWGKETSLVALSRQKEDVHLYVPRELAGNRDILVRQMSRSRAKRSTLQWAVLGDPSPGKAALMEGGKQDEAVVMMPQQDHLPQAPENAPVVKENAPSGISAPVSPLLLPPQRPAIQPVAIRRDQGGKSDVTGIMKSAGQILQAGVNKVSTTIEQIRLARQEKLKAEEEEQKKAKAAEAAERKKEADRKRVDAIRAKAIAVGLKPWVKLGDGRWQAETGILTILLDQKKWVVLKGGKEIAAGEAAVLVEAGEQALAVVKREQDQDAALEVERKRRLANVRGREKAAGLGEWQDDEKGGSFAFAPGHVSVVRRGGGWTIFLGNDVVGDGQTGDDEVLAQENMVTVLETVSAETVRIQKAEREAEDRRQERLARVRSREEAAGLGPWQKAEDGCLWASAENGVEMGRREGGWAIFRNKQRLEFGQNSDPVVAQEMAVAELERVVADVRQAVLVEAQVQAERERTINIIKTLDRKAGIVKWDNIKDNECDKWVAVCGEYNIQFSEKDHLWEILSKDCSIINGGYADSYYDLRISSVSALLDERERLAKMQRQKTRSKGPEMG